MGGSYCSISNGDIAEHINTLVLAYPEYNLEALNAYRADRNAGKIPPDYFCRDIILTVSNDAFPYVVLAILLAFSFQIMALIGAINMAISKKLIDDPFKKRATGFGSYK